MIKYEVRVYPSGTKYWYLNDKRHREDGSAVEYPDGTKEWYLNGKRHREDGPAIEFPDGDKHWYLNGERHREDGPAIEYSNGTKEWYLNGKGCAEAEFNKEMASRHCASGKVDAQQHIEVVIDGITYTLQPKE